MRVGAVGVRVVGALLAAIGLLAACSGSDQVRSGAEGAATGAAMKTYTGTMVASGPTRLLKVDEVRPLISFGFDIREQPVLDPKQFTMGTLRGPCGATVPTPYSTQGGFRILRSTITLLIEALAEPGVAPSRSFVDALAADLHPGCPDFEEQVGGAVSKVHLERALTDSELPGVGERRVGWLQKVTAPDGKVGYRIVLVIANGTRSVMLVDITGEPPNTAQLGELVRLVVSAS